MHVLDDGTEIECCPFYTEGIQCIDYSIDKAKFDASGKGDFKAYLNSIGFYTETVQVGDDKWYFEIIEVEKCYRAQYTLDYTSW